MEQLQPYVRVWLWRDDTHTGGLCCHHGSSICWSSRSPGRSIPDRYTRSLVGPLLARCDHPDQVHRAGMRVISGHPPILGREDQDEAGGMEGAASSGGEGPGRSVGSFDWATLALAHLYHGLDVWTRGSGESNWQFIRPLEVWAYEYRIYPGGPSDDTPAESWRIPRYLAHCHHTYASTEDPEYWRSFLNDRSLSDVRSDVGSPGGVPAGCDVAPGGVTKVSSAASGSGAGSGCC
ncbi:hypothetical protein JCGZ_18157 [Jatropha curcas]|uniref:Aminotransferase-like plant mobile domain-containing protein n=1 Tax=Jatropha curcas TaxID=180498 RepID=A0A067KDJ9_JATCU|nr:hypothetical protein JCGZ_18157 [Jatropha curcas]